MLPPPRSYTPPTIATRRQLQALEDQILQCQAQDAIKVRRLLAEMEALDPGGPRSCLLSGFLLSFPVEK